MEGASLHMRIYVEVLQPAEHKHLEEHVTSQQDSPGFNALSVVNSSRIIEHCVSDCQLVLLRHV